jgi:hypothetical protein
LAEVAISASYSELGAALKNRYDGLVQRIATYYPIPDDDPIERWADVVKGFEAA